MRVSFNPRPPRGGRHGTHERLPRRQPVSIHAPRAEGDVEGIVRCVAHRSFNPRPPRGGRRDTGVQRPHLVNVSIHAPRAEGDRRTRRPSVYWLCFNPRPPRGGRPDARGAYTRTERFQSTPPARRATRQSRDSADDGVVSIHAPRAEGDTGSPPRRACRTCFNPRPPRGGRLLWPIIDMAPREFQSTPPARRATRRMGSGFTLRVVSIHAPRAEGDGRRAVRHQRVEVSIHAPRAEGDL